MPEHTSIPGRSAAVLSITLLVLSAALAGCERRAPPEPQVPSTTTPAPATSSTTPPMTTPMPDSSASSAMPPASAASQ